MHNSISDLLTLRVLCVPVKYIGIYLFQIGLKRILMMQLWGHQILLVMVVFLRVVEAL